MELGPLVSCTFYHVIPLVCQYPASLASPAQPSVCHLSMVHSLFSSTTWYLSTVYEVLGLGRLILNLNSQQIICCVSVSLSVVPLVSLLVVLLFFFGLGLRSCACSFLDIFIKHFCSLFHIFLCSIFSSSILYNATVLYDPIYWYSLRYHGFSLFLTFHSFFPPKAHWAALCKKCAI